MKDDESHSIFNAYNKHQARLAKISYLREGFEEGKNPFAGDSNAPGGGNNNDDADDKSDDKSDNDTESKESSDDGESKSSDSKPSEPSSKPSEPSSKPSAPKKKDGKMSEEELDEELDVLAAKKDKIQKLFDSESIDKEVAQNALQKIKMLTNQLVEKYI